MGLNALGGCILSYLRAEWLFLFIYYYFFFLTDFIFKKSSIFKTRTIKSLKEEEIPSGII